MKNGSKLKPLSILMLLLGIIMHNAVYAQTMIVHGTVTDDQDQPLIGVSVVPKGSTAVW